MYRFDEEIIKGPSKIKSGMRGDDGKLTTSECVTGFLVKIGLGLLYGFIFSHFFTGDDTWRFHEESLKETAILTGDPTRFFVDEFTPEHAIAWGSGILDILHYYLIDLEYVIIVKIPAILNLLTGGNYYLNTIFFNTLVFLGHFWLFKSLLQFFPEQRRALFAAIFLFLPAIFWLSGWRSDGLIFLSFVFVFRALTYPDLPLWKRLVFMGLGFAGTLILRTELCALLLIFVIAYMLSTKSGSGQPLKPLLVHVLVYGGAAVLFFASGLFMPAGGFPAMVVGRQEEFFTLEGTSYALDHLTPSLGGFVRVLPQAAENMFLRPYPWEARGIFQILASAEVMLCWLLLLIAVIYRHQNWRVRLTSPTVLSLFFFSVTVALLTGFTVPFPGAIVRYKAVPELLTICALVVLVDWRKMKLKI